MSYLCLCDVCQQIIKIGEEKYILAVNEVLHQKAGARVMNYDDFVKMLQKRNEELQTHEICGKCKILLDKFLSLRRKELKKIEQELNFLEEEEKNGQNKKI